MNLLFFQSTKIIHFCHIICPDVIKNVNTTKKPDCFEPDFFMMVFVLAF